MYSVGERQSRQVILGEGANFLRAGIKWRESFGRKNGGDFSWREVFKDLGGIFFWR